MDLKSYENFHKDFNINTMIITDASKDINKMYVNKMYINKIYVNKIYKIEKHIWYRVFKEKTFLYLPFKYNKYIIKIT